MAKTKSIYMNDLTEAFALSLYRDDSNVSEAINMATDRYLLIVLRSIPALSNGEWAAVFDALNGYASKSSDAKTVAIMLPQQIYDAFQYQKYDLLDDEGYELLVDKLSALDTAGRIAVIHVAERFWSGNWGKSKSYLDIVEKIKLGK